MEDCSQCGIGPNGPDFWVGPRKPYITGIQFHLWMKYLKINLKLRPFPWITYFFQIFKINPLCVVLNHNQPGPKGPMPHGKGLKGAGLGRGGVGLGMDLMTYGKRGSPFSTWV
jgi:hypothetical protein